MAPRQRTVDAEVASQREGINNPATHRGLHQLSLTRLAVGMNPVKPSRLPATTPPRVQSRSWMKNQNPLGPGTGCCSSRLCHLKCGYSDAAYSSLGSQLAFSAKPREASPYLE